MIAEGELAQKKLPILELAEALGNVSDDSRRWSISCTQSYEYKCRVPINASCFEETCISTL